MRRLLLFLFSHRFLAIARWELHFIGIRFLNAASRQNRAIDRSLAAQRSSRFLNLGSGPRGLSDEHWINVDGFKGTNVHFLLDISRRLPFPDATFHGIFCEHVLEHFSMEDGERVAGEAHRILTPGGRFRIVMPDAELVARRYIEDPNALIGYRGAVGTAMESVNDFFRQRYEHQFLYDWPTLELMLKRAGFHAVVRTSFGQSGLFDLVLDDKKYEWESLYVEAIKL